MRWKGRASRPHKSARSFHRSPAAVIVRWRHVLDGNGHLPIGQQENGKKTIKVESFGCGSLKRMWNFVICPHVRMRRRV